MAKLVPTQTMDVVDIDGIGGWLVSLVKFVNLVKIT